MCSSISHDISYRVRIEADAATGVVRKFAEGHIERQRLAHEAAVLRSAAHPGVVQISASDPNRNPGVLELRRVEGSTIGALSPLDAGGGMRVGAALATTIADLHDVGITHGSIRPEHVLIDEQGRPVLCGFGSARRASSTTDFASAKRADVVAIARLLIDASPELRGAHVGAFLDAAAGGEQRTRWRARVIDARSLAQVLAAATSSDGSRAARSGSAHLRRPRKVMSLAVVALAAGAAAGLYSAVGATSPGRDRRAGALAQTDPDRPAAQRCPSQDAGCVPLHGTGGLVAGRFRILGADGATVLGRWNCTDRATPAILDEPSGNVWVFDSWPRADQHVTARLLGTVAGASALRVVPPPARARPGSTGCDAIEVERSSDRPPVILDPSARKSVGPSVATGPTRR